MKPLDAESHRESILNLFTIEQVDLLGADELRGLSREVLAGKQSISNEVKGSIVWCTTSVQAAGDHRVEMIS